MPQLWLDETEMDAWRTLLRAHAHLMAALDSELQAAHGIPLGDYEVLVHLAECPKSGRRMSDLAERLVLSRSGLTRRIDGLVKLGLVERRPCAEDGRATMAIPTKKGLKLLESAAPCHVAGVRRHMIDRLSPQQLRDLTAALARVAEPDS